MSEEKEVKIVWEVAENDFKNWCEDQDIDDDVKTMDEDDQKGFENSKRRIIRAVIAGHLIFNDDGLAEYTPHREKSSFKDTLTFHEYTGGDLSAGLDGNKKNQNVKATYKTMAKVCKCRSIVFDKMAGPDLKVCQSIFMLLTA